MLEQKVVRLSLIGDISELEKGINQLCDVYGFEICSAGIPIYLEKTDKNLEVKWEGFNGQIGYSKKVHFFRALGLFLEAYRTGKTFNITETPQLESVGAMFDLSRNGVLKVDSIEKFLRYMAVIGMDKMMMYIEDTYTIAGEPYFGYFRGRYSYDELKHCDDYANMFGIEIVPFIQTLGHLQQYLKWVRDPAIKDTDDILLVDSDKTYELIRRMVVEASAPFRSKSIHLGMDEAEQVGLGRYLRLHGYEKRFDIMARHLDKVIEITESLGLEPMIWSDMFFKLGSSKGEYYDLDAFLPEELLKKIPSQLSCVFWSYYHENEDFYREMLKKHEKMGKKTIFAGGIWTFVGMNLNYGKTFATTNAAMNACKKEGVSEVFATLWGDDGTEADFFTALPCLQLFAEHGYSDNLDMEHVKKRFEYCSGASFEAFMSLQSMDEIPGVSKDNLDVANPSKPLLWQDILLGLVDKHVEGHEVQIKAHYKKMKDILSKNRGEQSRWGYIFNVPCLLADVLSLKADMGVRIKRAYELRDREELMKICMHDLPQMTELVSELRKAHRRQWFLHNKPFGWDVIDIRYGGVLARIDTAISRITDFLNGSVSRIEELDQERLLYPDFYAEGKEIFPNINSYTRISSACNYYR